MRMLVKMSTFTTHHGLFKFIRMPFGLCNALATFQRLIRVVLSGHEGTSCFVDLDDILTFEDLHHLHHAKRIPLIRMIK